MFLLCFVIFLVIFSTRPNFADSFSCLEPLTLKSCRWLTIDQVAYDFSLKRAVIEVDRDADRRWSFATDKMKLAEDKDEVAPNSAPLEDATKASLKGT